RLRHVHPAPAGCLRVHDRRPRSGARTPPRAPASRHRRERLGRPRGDGALLRRQRGAGRLAPRGGIRGHRRGAVRQPPDALGTGVRRGAVRERGEGALRDAVPTRSRVRTAHRDHRRGRAVGERWREYYSPTYDLWVLGAWLVAFGVVLSRVIRRRLWRRDRDLGREVTTIVGLWALPPSLALFVLYAKVGNLVTRYLVDMYPAFAAVMLCAAMAVVDVVRERGPKRVWAAQLGLAVLAVIYDSARPGWPHQINRPVDRAAVEARLEGIDARSREQPIPSDHVAATDPRGVDPVYHHFAEWKRDGTFQSGMVFAMPRHPCLEFTFAPRGAGWTASDEASLAGFRANADFDALVRCDAP